MQAARDALAAASGIPEDLIAEFDAALTVFAAPPREPWTPDWMSGPATPARYFADVNCTQEILPEKDGMYRTPEGQLAVYVAAEPGQRGIRIDVLP